MNGKQAKRIRRAATLIWIKDVKPAGEALVAEIQAEIQAGGDSKTIQGKLAQLPSPRRLYRRLKHLYTRRA